MAGHSKWANIQHRKSRQDAVRAKLFSKLSKEITVAARMGDPDPDKNPRLRLAVKEAKSNSVPKDVIERAIRKSQSGEGDSYEEIRYEGYGVAGVAVLVEAMTDNRNRTAASVRTLFAKNGGNLGESGSVAFLFVRTGEIIYPKAAGSDDAVLEAAMDAGADDCNSDDDGHVLYCPPSGLSDVAAALESALGEAATVRLIWRPETTQILDDADTARKLLKLIEALESDDDIQNVTTNADVSEQTLALLNA